MTIERLRPELAKDYEGFFSGPAFLDNPEWKGCWCTFFHRPKDGEEEAAQAASRAGRLSLALAGEPMRAFALRLIAQGRMHGYLAYDDAGSVAGWLNAGPKDAYARLAAMASGDPAAARTLAVVCFVVHPERRRSGVARAMLERAIADARAEGMAAVEAWPGPRTKTEAGNFHGPRALYESLGFTVEKRGRGLVARLDLR